MNCVGSSGLLGSWYFSWATSRLRNVLASTPGRLDEEDVDEEPDDEVELVEGVL
jgi:hypothetical protein